MTDYLTLEDLVELTRLIGVGPVRDVGLLDTAAGRPRVTVFGDDAYPTIADKAAALLHSLTCNHPLVDGNKRLAWLATVVFLDINGFAPELTDDQAFELVMSIASGEVAEVAAIAARLNAQSKD